jgi:hypothetical protein
MGVFLSFQSGEFDLNQKKRPFAALGLLFLQLEYAL